MAFSRNTKQRDAIRSAFEREDRPLSPEEVLALAKEESTQIGIATIYRSIKGLVAEGWLTTVELVGEPPRYERSGKHHHHHFRCRICNKVYDLEGCLGHLDRLVPQGFRVEDHHIILDGTCATCSASSAG
ncbi:MAG: transcriptional repressor [Deltaproteobacteria bacterium]|nr:transcriptional repressor [Deltaproteobacteria bacterium]